MFWRVKVIYCNRLVHMSDWQELDCAVDKIKEQLQRRPQACVEIMQLGKDEEETEG